MTSFDSFLAREKKVQETIRSSREPKSIQFFRRSASSNLHLFEDEKQWFISWPLTRSFLLRRFIGNFSPEIEEQRFSSDHTPPLTCSATRCDERTGPLNEGSGTNEHIFLKARARKQSQWRGLLSFRDDWLVCKYVFLLFSLGPSSNFLSQKSTGCLTGKRSIYVQVCTSSVRSLLEVEETEMENDLEYLMT